MTFVAVDWGTSSLRGALIDDEGRALEVRHAARGILSVGEGAFPDVFHEIFGDWMAPPGRRCLISGMAGSQQGWVEAPYCPCPADAGAVARQVVPVDDVPHVDMVPGLSTEQNGRPDVMRGEEIQVIGAMALLQRAQGLFMLPGTHNKWVQVEGGRITGFRTFMTGEFYALLSQHSILARTLDAKAPLDEGAFRQGLDSAQQGHGLLHSAFSARTLRLFDRLTAAQAANYLSGLLIGEELRAQALDAASEVVLIGAAGLTTRYALALDALGLKSNTLGDEATWAGAHAIHQALGPSRAGEAT